MRRTAPPLTLHTEINSAAEIVVTAVGEIDHTTSPAFERHLAASVLTVDVIDLRFVTFIDAAGITQLLTTRSDGLAVVASRQVRRLLEICDLTGRFDVRDPNSAPPVFHRARFGVAVHSEDLRWVYVNNALATINGLPPSAHYGLRPDELFDVESDDLTPVLERVVATGHYEHAAVASEIAGVARLFDCHYYPGEIAGRPVVVAVVEPEATDTTADDTTLALDIRPLAGRT